MYTVKYGVKEDLLKKTLIIAVIVGIVYALRSMLNMALLTFLFTFIFYNIQKLIFNLLHKHIPIVNKKSITISIYLVICILIGFFSFKYVPVITRQLIIISHKVSNFDIEEYHQMMSDSIFNSIKNIDFKSYINTTSAHLIGSLTGIGKWSMNIFLALVLSFVFNLEKDEILNFIKRLETSKIDFIYKYCSYFGRTFLNSFGKVMQMQMIVSCVDAILSLIWLSILGFHQALGLAFLIFILGLIPVAGIVIALIPLCILAFKLGGISKVINVLIMVGVLHAVESYILKPKLMSMQIELPIFFTFAILIVAEHAMGIWGLLLGIPLFMFLLDVLGVQLCSP